MLTLLKNINSEVLLRSLVSMPVTKENAVQPADIWARRICYSARANAKTIAGITTLKDWVSFCSSDAAREPVEYIRSISDDNKRNEEKERLPMFFPSAVLSVRDKNVGLDDKIVSYPGFICMDFDFHDKTKAQAAVEEFRQVGYFAFVGLSASGAGVYAIAVVDNADFKQHKKYWKAVSNDIAERFGYKNDIRTQDVTHGRFLSYNPTPVINEEVTPFSLPEGYEEPTAADYGDADEDFPPDDTTLAAVEDCVRQWEESGLVLGDTTYEIRYNLGTALKNLGEAGFKFYERLCRGYTHPRTPREEFDSFPDNAAACNTNENKIRLGRFFKVMELQFHIKPTEEEVRLPLDEQNTVITEIVEEVAKVYQCPREFCIAAMFSAVAAVAGKKFALWDGKYTNYAQLWAAIVAPSGTGKSEVLSWFFKPVEGIETEEYKAYQVALQEWKEGGEKGHKPKFRRCTAVDTTPEVRDQILADNPNGLCLVVDELRGLFGDMGRYNKSGEVERLLSVFSNRSYNVDRKTQEPLRIVNPVLSIVGTIQPGVFAQAFGSPQFTGNGFLPRWCFIWNNEHPARCYSDLSVHPGISAKWAEIIRYIDAADGEITFQLSQPARDLYEAFYNEMEGKIHRTPDDTKKEMYAKLQVNILRWALIAAILAGEYEESVGCGEISAESMEYAVECFRYFEKTGLKAVEAARGQSSQMTKKDALLALYRAYPTLSRARLAEAIGTSMPYLSKVLKGPK